LQYIEKSKSATKFEKSNPKNRNLQMTSPKNEQFTIQTSNPQVLKKLQLHKNPSPNSLENREVGNAGPVQSNRGGRSYFFRLRHRPCPEIFNPVPGSKNFQI